VKRLEREAKAVAKAAGLKARSWRIASGLGGDVGVRAAFVDRDWDDAAVCRGRVEKTREAAFGSLLETFASKPSWKLPFGLGEVPGAATAEEMRLKMELAGL
jgi:hypothetical protein